jgi:hypothetical protein
MLWTSPSLTKNAMKRPHLCAFASQFSAQPHHRHSTIAQYGLFFAAAS